MAASQPSKGHVWPPRDSRKATPRREEWPFDCGQAAIRGLSTVQGVEVSGPGSRRPRRRRGRPRGRGSAHRGVTGRNDVVELVDERHAGRDVEPGDVVVGDAVERLDEGTQRVAVGGDHDGQAVGEVGLDLVLPVGHQPRHDVLEALGGRHRGAEPGVAGVAVLRELVVLVDGRRRHVVGAAPQHELLLAELLEGLLLVLALQRAVVALVEAPVALDRDPVPVGRVEREVRGRDGPAQQRRVHDVGQDAGLLELLAGAHALGAALVGEVDVDPAGEEVLGVPVAFAVTDEDERVGHGASLATADQASDPSSSRCRKASRLRVDSPRETRQAHSFLIEPRKPSASSSLKTSSLADSTMPKSWSRWSASTATVGTSPAQVDVAVGVDGVGDPLQPQVLAQQRAVERLVVLVRVADDEGAEARRPVAHEHRHDGLELLLPGQGHDVLPHASAELPVETDRAEVCREAGLRAARAGSRRPAWCPGARRSRDHRRRDADEALALVDRRLVGAVGALSDRLTVDLEEPVGGRAPAELRGVRDGRRTPAPGDAGSSRSSDSTASVQSGVAWPSTRTPASPTAVGRPPTSGGHDGGAACLGLDGDEAEGLRVARARATRSAARYHCARTGRSTGGTKRTTSSMPRKRASSSSSCGRVRPLPLGPPRTATVRRRRRRRVAAAAAHPRPGAARRGP